MKKKLLLVGSGGHTVSCIDVIELEKKYHIIGLIDLKKNKIFRKYEVIGNPNKLKDLKKKTKNIFITIGQINSPKLRINLFNKLNKLGFKLVKIVSPLSYLSKNSSIGEGTIIMHGAYVGPNVKIGKNCIINTNAIIEHDTIIKDNCHISTTVTINGGVKINSGSFVGSGSVIRQGINLKSNSFIKMGTYVKK